MLNKAFVMGRLARDPELQYTPNGTPVATFRLAVDRDFKDKASGERGVDWIDVVAWRQTGEFVSHYFSKGRMAVVEGRIQVDTWTDSKTGDKRTRWQVVADQVYFGDSKPAIPSEGNAPEASLPKPAQMQLTETGDEDGELPF